MDEDDKQRLLQEDVDPDESTLEELTRILVDQHIEDTGFIGAVSRCADRKLKELGE